MTRFVTRFDPESPCMGWEEAPEDPGFGREVSRICLCTRHLRARLRIRRLGVRLLPGALVVSLRSTYLLGALPLGPQDGGGFRGSGPRGRRPRQRLPVERPIPVQPGVPLAVRAAWQAASFAGIGTYLYANVNAEEMFGGVALTFEVGHLR